MFIVCWAVCFGNGIDSSSNYETPNQVEGDGLQKGKGKNKGLLFQQAFLRGIGSFMEWNKAGNGKIKH